MTKELDPPNPGGTMSDNVLTFSRRPINEWPREVYLADFGDGDGCRPYAFIQHPDDTTPRYVRGDLHEAQIASEREARDKAMAALRHKDEAMSVLFRRLEENDIDYSDLVS